MKTTFSLAFSWSCRPFCWPTVETHVEMAEEHDEQQLQPVLQDETEQ